jgi:hypothetical protein
VEDHYDEVEQFMHYLEDEGVLEWVGMSTDGDRTFVFNFEKMAEIFPELYDAMLQELDEEFMNLYKLGFVTIEYDVDLIPKFRLTDAGKKYLEDNGYPIPEDFDGPS